MAHMWDRGVLDASSWHGLEEVGVFTDADSLIQHGEQAGSYPVSLSAEALFTRDGLTASLKALVAKYPAHPDRIVGTNGSRYRATTPDDVAKAIAALSDTRLAWMTGNVIGVDGGEDITA